MDNRETERIGEMERMVDSRVNDIIKESHGELLKEIGGMISQIGGSNSSLLSQSKTLIIDAPTFKRTYISNEEQFKQNAKILEKLELAECSTVAQNPQQAKESIIEGNTKIKMGKK